MEQHGINPEKNVIAIIPARYSSTRLPGKLLLEIGGVPMIVRTMRQAGSATTVDRVIIAADDMRIKNVVEENGGECVMTSAAHESGSDRIAEVATGLPEDSVIVNVQGDEPFISPRTIDAAVSAILNDDSLDIVTTCEEITDFRDVLSPNVVKVVTDGSGRALYFSRSPIPYPRDPVNRHGSIEAALSNETDLIKSFRKHTGIYVYRREFLLKFSKMAPSPLERTEMLEQLRALENGARIGVVDAADSSIGIDTIEDLERAREFCRK